MTESATDVPDTTTADTTTTDVANVTEGLPESDDGGADPGFDPYHTFVQLLDQAPGVRVVPGIRVAVPRSLVPSERLAAIFGSKLPEPDAADLSTLFVEGIVMDVYAESCVVAIDLDTPHINVPWNLLGVLPHDPQSPQSYVMIAPPTSE